MAEKLGLAQGAAAGADFEMAAGRARDHVEQHTRIATDILKKPLVLEEFGLPRDHETLFARFAHHRAG